jgi:competence protein ComEC
MDDRLAPALEAATWSSSAPSASLPQQGASGLRFRFEIESALLGGAPVVVPPRVALGWYKGFHEDATLSEPQRTLRAGQRWRFAVRLRQPHGNLNPHGFDHELNLLEQGVRATGYVRGAPAELLDPEAGFVVERMRQRVRDAIEASVADRRAAGVLAALAVGDQGAIDREDWDLFRNTGVAHLMSISGLHVTMFAWLAGVGVALLWRLSPQAMLRVPVPLVARVGGLVAALGYAIFSGWGVPAQRTVWMLATVVLLQLSGLRWPWLLVLLLAAAVVTALDPWALMQPGFWLSFMAVGLLMASSPIDGSAGAHDAASDEPAPDRGPVRRFADLLRGALRTQVIATLGLAPLTLVFFQQVSLVGFVANLFAIPLVTLVITPLALLGTLLAPLWSAGAWVVQGLAAALQSLEAVPGGAVWSVAVAPVWAQIAGLLGAVLLVLPLPWRVRVLAPLLVLPLLMPSRNLPAEGQFDLIALDVGQGTAIVVRTHAHVLVYDAGPQYARDSDAGQRVLLPYLRATGTARIDRLVLSHRDSDHTGGARALLTALPVGDLLSSLETAHPLLGLGQRRQPLRRRPGLDLGRRPLRRAASAGRRLRARPEAERAVVRRARRHCRTQCAARRRHRARPGSGTRRRPGGRAAQRRADRAAPRQPDVVDRGVPRRAQPATAVFQAGYRSRFGHPAPDVVARYRERGIAVVASPACGAWRWPHAGSRTELHNGTCRAPGRPSILAPRRRARRRPRGALATGFRRTRDGRRSAWPELC